MNPQLAAALSLVAGLIAGTHAWAWYRLINAKFPLNFIGPVWQMAALSGAVVGVLLAARSDSIRDKLAVPVLLTCGLAVHVLANMLHKDQSVHFLLLDIYYEFPAHRSALVMVASIVIGALSSGVPLAVAVRFQRMYGAESLVAGPLLLAGFGLGLGC